ncbi:MAG: aminotransferase class I/II-fold pyridoxal phosphate-dependent enzyme, partial [bacterium]
PGEKVVCADQRWENYDLIIQGNLHLEIVSFPLFDKNNMNIDGFIEALTKCAQNQRMAAAIVNFPNNPTGFMPGTEDREKLKQAVLKIADAGKKIILIFDDAYDGYVFDPQVPRYSPFGDFVNLHQNIYPIKLDGMSKEFLIYGGRIGCITAGLHEPAGLNEGWAQELTDKITALIRSTFSNSSHLLQAAAVRALEDAAPAIERERETIRSILHNRWQQLLQLFGEFPHYRVDPFNSGFFCLVNIKDVDAAKLADHLLKKCKIGTVPTQIPDAGINALRIAFCSVMDNDIPRLVSDLQESLSKLCESV